MKKIFSLALATLATLLMFGCQRDMKAIWTGGSGSVPVSCAAPTGFTISPSAAQDIADKRFGKKKTVQHIYADSTNYYIVNGFAGSSRSSALKEGTRVNGKTGECSRTD